MNMINQLFGNSFRVNYAHPIYSSRKHLLRQNSPFRLSRLRPTPYVAGGLVVLSFISILSFCLVFANGGTPKVDGFSSDEVLRRLSITFNKQSAREASLLRVSQEQNLRFDSITHFISDIILKHQRSGSYNQAKKIASSIVSESTRLGFDPLFIASVIKYESTFNPLARSSAGAVGLMQMMPSTRNFILQSAGTLHTAASNLHDPAQNIKLGILYLAYLRTKFRGNKEQMLIAYNWGPENLKRALKSGRVAPGSTIHYARRVITHHREWQRAFESQASRYRHFNFGRVDIARASTNKKTIS
jgi:hypothetical protein